MTDAVATAKRIRLAIAEDHKVVADALATMLGFGDEIDVVGVVSSGADIVELDAELAPDVILMDITLEGLNGLEACRLILRDRPDARIIVLTMHDDPDTVTDAMAAGAVGFLPKNASRTDLLAAVKAVYEGGGYLHASVTRDFLGKMGPLASQAAASDRLTDRERDVLELLAAGNSTKAIANALVLGEETVKTHLAHIYQKLGVNDRVQAVALAIRRGLVR